MKFSILFSEGEIVGKADLGMEGGFYFRHVCPEWAVEHPVRGLPGIWIEGNKLRSIVWVRIDSGVAGIYPKTKSTLYTLYVTQLDKKKDVGVRPKNSKRY